MQTVPTQAEGLSSLPVNDLGGIIARIAATRLAKGQQQQPAGDSQQQQQLAAAAASAAASMAEGDVSSLPHIVQEAMPQAWKALASAAGKMVEMFRPVAFIENTETDTQVRAAVQLHNYGCGRDRMLCVKAAVMKVHKVAGGMLCMGCLLLN